MRDTPLGMQDIKVGDRVRIGTRKVETVTGIVKNNASWPVITDHGSVYALNGALTDIFKSLESIHGIIRSARSELITKEVSKELEECREMKEHHISGDAYGFRAGDTFTFYTSRKVVFPIR